MKVNLRRTARARTLPAPAVTRPPDHTYEPARITTSRPLPNHLWLGHNSDRRLLLRHPLGTAVVRGGSLEPCLPLVLSARARWRGAGPFDLLEEPAWPVPRERPVAQGVRDDRAALHGRGVG